MSENTQAQSSGENEVQSNSATQEEQTAQKWTYEQLQSRLKKVNEEARDERKTRQELQKKLDDIQRSKLAEEGQFKELVKLYQQEAEEAKGYAGKLKDAFSMKIVSDAVAMEAQKLGCVDADALLNLVNLNELPIDENFSVDRNHVKTVLEDMKKKKPYFFESKQPKVIDALPVKPEPPKVKSVQELSSQDIEKVLLTKFGKK